MSFPVNFVYFKNYTLANIPTKLIYKHRVDYHEYITVLHSIHTAATYQNGFAHQKLHVGRGVQASDKRTLGKVHASGNAHWGKFTHQETNIGRGSRIGNACWGKMNVKKRISDECWERDLRIGINV